MRFRRSRRLTVRAMPDIVPLVTVLFQLMLFFVLTSTFPARTSLNFEYAQAPGPVTLEQKDLSITLAYGEGGPDGKGPVYVNDKAVADMSELARILAAAHAERPELLLLIRPDARIASSRLIEVLGIAQNAGIDRYRLAAEPSTDTVP